MIDGECFLPYETHEGVKRQRCNTDISASNYSLSGQFCKLAWIEGIGREVR